MVSLVVMFTAGLAIGHGSPLKDDVGAHGAQFAVDQRGKLVVYKADAMPAESDFSAISERVASFMEAKGNKTVAKGADRLESTGSVKMKKHAGIGNHVAGSINYTMVVENQNGELNYWFTDLTYQPYRNDRYGKRIKATASPIPLESTHSTVNAGVWNKQKGYAYEALDELADQVLAQMESAGKPQVVTTSR